MRPIIIEISDPITIDQLRDCAEKAYDAGYKDGMNSREWYINTNKITLTDDSITPNLH